MNKRHQDNFFFFTAAISVFNFARAVASASAFVFTAAAATLFEYAALLLTVSVKSPITANVEVARVVLIPLATV